MGPPLLRKERLSGQQPIAPRDPTSRTTTQTTSFTPATATEKYLVTSSMSWPPSSPQPLSNTHCSPCSSSSWPSSPASSCCRCHPPLNTSATALAEKRSPPLTWRLSSWWWIRLWASSCGRRIGARSIRANSKCINR